MPCFPGPTTPTACARLRRTRAVTEGTSFEEALRAQGAMNPMRVLGDASDFGAVVAFLCSQQARFVTGENVLVDGGAYAGLV
jgi:3-oxoacyl-[acyl-carrier protein] reductase